MYASQILVDPSDDQRIYMMNSYSFSDDGGAPSPPRDRVSTATTGSSGSTPPTPAT